MEWGGEGVLQKQEANQLASHLISQPIRQQINDTKAEVVNTTKKLKVKSNKEQRDRRGGRGAGGGGRGSTTELV